MAAAAAMETVAWAAAARAAAAWGAAAWKLKVPLAHWTLQAISRPRTAG